MAATGRTGLGAAAHLDGRHEQRRPSLVARRLERELEPQPRAVGRPQFRLEALGRGLALVVAAQDFTQQVREIVVHQVDELASGQLGRRGGAAELGEAGIGELDAIALDGHALVHRLGEAPVDLLPLGARRALLLQPREQTVRVLRETLRAAAGRVRRQPLGKIARRGDRRQALAEVAHMPRLALAPVQEHREKRGERAQDGQRDDQQVIIGTGHVLRTGARCAISPENCCSESASTQHNGTGRAHPPDSP